MDQHPKKLTVYAFADKRLEQKTAEFVLPINPEQYEQTLKVEYDVQPAQGAQGVEGRFKSSAPEELKLDFVFDGTNTVYGYAQEGRSVPEQIDALKGVVYDLQGEIHQPRYLKLVWKDFTFDCILTELKITYTLFDPEGTPLRAKLSCTFLNYRETERRVREEGKSSPDLTHTRTVHDQDNLPLLTHRIYGAPDYYMEVALANNLTSFRRLRTGQTLRFPPLDKTEK
jgi:nucleoid-associated protein YgaU